MKTKTHFLLILCALAFACCQSLTADIQSPVAGASSEQSERPAGLSLWWSFNESSTRGLYDSSGHSNHGRISGETVREEGRIGKALLFGPGRSASGRFAEAAMKAGFEESSFTLTAWVKADGE